MFANTVCVRQYLENELPTLDLVTRWQQADQKKKKKKSPHHYLARLSVQML